MSAISGKDGKILIGSTPIAHITQWTFNPSADLDNFASSSTAGYQDNVEGTSRGSGTLDFKVDDSTPQIGTTGVLRQGLAVTLKLYLDATRFYEVPARIESLNVSTVIDGGPAITGSASFQTRGAWTEPTI